MENGCCDAGTADKIKIKKMIENYISGGGGGGGGGGCRREEEAD